MTATDVFRGEQPQEQPAPAPVDTTLWSVTTLIGVLDKPALVQWAANCTAEEAVTKWKTWTAMAKQSGPEEAMKWLSKARWRNPPDESGAAELGTRVHAVCEEYALTGIRPAVDDEVRPFFEQFDRWLQLFSPSYQATEVTVYSPTYGYAGQCDGFFTIDGTRFIFDYKTTKKAFDKKGNPAKAYPEVALQLAAYRYAEWAAVWRPRRYEHYKRRYYLLSPEERAAAVKVPEVDTGLCIKITREHCYAYPVECGPEIFRSFLHTIEAARFQFEQSQRVIGAPLVPPGKEVAA